MSSRKYIYRHLGSFFFFSIAICFSKDTCVDKQVQEVYVAAVVKICPQLTATVNDFSPLNQLEHVRIKSSVEKSFRVEIF